MRDVSHLPGGAAPEPPPIANLRRLGALEWVEARCRFHGVELLDVLNPKKRSQSITRARREIRTVVAHTFGLSLHEAASVFDVDHTTMHSTFQARLLEIAGALPHPYASQAHRSDRL